MTYSIDQPGRQYTDAMKNDAIEKAVELGLMEAERATGIPRSTIWGWCSRSGMDMSELSAQQLERTQRRTRNATLASVARWEEHKAKVQLALEEATQLGLERTIERLKEKPDDVRTWDLVGIWTRAIHDSQLLAGEATERTERLLADPEAREAQGRALVEELVARLREEAEHENGPLPIDVESQESKAS